MALRNRAYDTNIKDIRKLRGAKAIPIELDEPDEIDLANAQDLEAEFMADFEFLYNDYIPPVNMMGEPDYDICDPWDMAYHQEPRCY